MQSIEDLINQARDKLSKKTYLELAKYLGISRERIYDYRHGKVVPSNWVCKKLAELLGRPLDEVIAVVEANSEKDEGKKNEWLNYSKGIIPTLAICIFSPALLYGNVTNFVTSENITVCNQKVTDCDFNSLRIMRLIMIFVAFMQHTFSKA